MESATAASPSWPEALALFGRNEDGDGAIH